MTEDLPEPQEDKVQQRKRELEAELDRYAQAGVASPGILKASRWLSRFLYLAMAVLVFYLLFSGWGAVSKQEFEGVVKQRNDLQKKLHEQENRAELAENTLGQALADQVRLRSELNDALDPARKSDAASREARLLIDRARGELAYAAHWREKLAQAQPDAHGIEPVEGVRQLLRQAASQPASVQFETLRETADFGEAACRQAATELLGDNSPGVRALAPTLLQRVGGDAGAVATAAANEKDVEAARELWFNWSLMAQTAPGGGVLAPEAWVGYTIRKFDASLGELVQRCKDAPGQIELFALLCEAAGADQAAFMTEVAVATQRDAAERILAVHWIAERNVEEGSKVLQGLAGGTGPVAAEAEKALEGK